MSADDFNDSFIDKELKEIKLTTWTGGGDGIIHLRSLPDFEVNRFRILSVKIANKKAISMLSGSDSVAYNDWDDDLARAEYYLIKSALCDSKGELLFNNDSDFNKFTRSVKSAVVNEIICHIENLNELYGGFATQEEVLESYKKK